MAWKLLGFDCLVDQLAPRDQPQWIAWLDQLAADPYSAGEPLDDRALWRAVGLDCAVCSYEIDEKACTVFKAGFYLDDAWQAETS